jgi:hypothetical protein
MASCRGKGCAAAGFVRGHDHIGERVPSVLLRDERHVPARNPFRGEKTIWWPPLCNAEQVRQLRPQALDFPVEGKIVGRKHSGCRRARDTSLGPTAYPDRRSNWAVVEAKVIASGRGKARPAIGVEKRHRLEVQSGVATAGHR